MILVPAKKFVKSVGYIAVITLALQLIGCASLQKKFTRKPKEPLHRPVVIALDQGAYQKPYSNDYYYKTHYTFWHTWHDELLNELGGNSKRVEHAAEEAFSNLQSMNNYLTGDKKTQLALVIDSYSAALRKIDNGRIVSGEEGSVKSELERISRTVASNFYYDKVKDSLLPDTVDLGNGTPPKPSPSA